MHKNDTASKIKEIATLSEIMSEHIRIKRSGRNITCCCPFHDDKSPSMSISDERGFYHCFGCGASGDVFSFLQEYLGMSFKDALKYLADRYGIEITSQPVRKEAENEVLILLQECFAAELQKNASALRYLKERGLSAASIAEFNLGYAPSNAATIRLLEHHQIPPQRALEQGAIKQNEKGLYASFIERITFAITNEFGELIGFGARTLNPNNPAKYVNSPACKLFDKKRIFYGYLAAKAAIRKQKMMLVCEGYMDVIAFHQAGIKHAVAALGVAMGEEHLRLINKNTFVRLCFDSDTAGRTAAFKAACLLAENGYNGDVINLSPYKDAGEFIQRGKEQQLVQAASLAGQNIIAYAIDFIFCKELEISELAQHVNTDPFIKKQAIAQIMQFCAKLDKFIANQHLELFSKRANLNLFEQEIKSVSRFPVNKSAPSSSSQMEQSVFYFIAACRKDFADILLIDKFSDQHMATLLARCEFDHPDVLLLLQNTHSASAINIVGFLSNLASIYALSAQGTKQQLLHKYASALRARQRQILGSTERLKAAYLLLLDLNAFEYENVDLSMQLIYKINKLGD